MIAAGITLLIIGALVFASAVVIHGINMASLFKGDPEPSSKIVIGPVMGGLSYVIIAMGLIILIVGVVLQFL